MEKTLKKVLALLMLATTMFSILGCSGDNKEKAVISEEEQQQQLVSNNSDTKILVVYFSWSGNTKKVAEKIKDETSADIFSIVTKEEYPQNYEDTVDVAKKEQRENARPELSTHIDNLSQYDTIFIGFPNWWGDMPMALYTFFDEYDFSGKTMVPFCTHGGSGLSDTVNSIKKEESNATVFEGLAIRDSNIDKSDDDVITWLEGLNLEK
ncbi:flavodoxin [Clostridium butyricum]|uniref:flavodoxin n=1 Tax=Clostridium butyricum TaxID=1492 RepID=UPI00071CD00D|nr:flavodoxin [Clostridium butyricum]MDU0325000.1 flavodoxin [Clostridium butyricum]